MKTVVYPGTFDPVSFGHIDLMRRAASIFDLLVVGVAKNENKRPLFSMEDRVKMIKEATAEIKNIKILPFDSLLVDFVKENRSNLILKGLRAISDFEYELQMSFVNRKISAGGIETVLMMPSEEYSFISSTVVKEVASLGGDISKMAPANVIKALKSLYRKTERFTIA